MLSKVIAVQSMLGERLGLEERIHIFKQRPDFVCLPEYGLIDHSTSDYYRAALSHQDNLAYLRRLSDELSICLIAGTVVEPEGDRIYNTCYVIANGEIVGKYRKRHPVPGEMSRGITPGSDPLVLEVDGVRIAILICGDVFFSRRYEELRAERVDLIFVPTTSLFRPQDSISQKRFRDQKYFIDGALVAAGYVVKTCGVGEIFGRPLQGRSLVAAPWGILSHVTPPDELHRRMLIQTLDIGELREFRRKYLHEPERLIPEDVARAYQSFTTDLDLEKLN